MQKKVAVILSGCGVYDGAEIHESVLTLLRLDQRGAQVQCFAPDIPQLHVVDHYRGDEMDQTRNVLVESARIDGCSNFQIFWRLIAPMAMPAMAAFATLQFLWVWNDFLVALVFLGKAPDQVVLTIQLNDLLGSRGESWEILTASAFVSIAVPVAVFFSLQRFFVRGLLSGSVK